MGGGGGVALWWVIGREGGYGGVCLDSLRSCKRWG
jgi:hypothetical protein